MTKNPDKSRDYRLEYTDEDGDQLRLIPAHAGRLLVRVVQDTDTPDEQVAAVRLDEGAERALLDVLLARAGWAPLTDPEPEATEPEATEPDPLTEDAVRSLVGDEIRKAFEAFDAWGNVVVRTLARDEIRKAFGSAHTAVQGGVR